MYPSNMQIQEVSIHSQMTATGTLQLQYYTYYTLHGHGPVPRSPSCANGAGVGLRKVIPHEAAQQRGLSHIRIANQQDFEQDVIVPVSHGQP